MLTNKKVTVVGDSIVTIDGVNTKVASFGAIVNSDGGEMTLTTRIIDTNAYEANQEAVAADRTAFETFAFTIENALDDAGKT